MLFADAVTRYRILFADTLMWFADTVTKYKMWFTYTVTV